MFGRRRRTPILGAAVVIGASRHAARREVAMQSQAASNAELQRRAAQEDQDRRTQLAIDEALARERAEREAIEQKAQQKAQQMQAQAGPGVAQGPPPYIVNQNLAPDAFFCGACGVLAKRSDTFCSACGRRHPKDPAQDMNMMAEAKAN